MVTDKIYCVDLLVELRDRWLTCYIIYSPDSTVKGGTHILHDLIFCKCNISYFYIFIKKPKLNLWSNEINFFISFFCLGLFMVQVWRYTAGQKNFLLFNDTHRENLCFTHISTIVGALLLNQLSSIKFNQLSSIHSIITY